MPLAQLKTKTTQIVGLIGIVGALITGVSYITPVIKYAKNIHKSAIYIDSIQIKLKKYDEYISIYQQEQREKKNSFAVGLRSSKETHQLMYVDKDGGMYRAWLDDETKRYFYYDVKGQPVFCYTKEPKHRTITPSAMLIQPLQIPDTTIKDSILSIQ